MIPIREVQRLQNLYVVAFFRRWLRDELAYETFLQTAFSDANEPAVTFFERAGCGEGFEMALLLPAAVVSRRALRRRRRQAEPAAPASFGA